MFARKGGDFRTWVTFIICYLVCTSTAHKHTGPRTTTTTARPAHAQEPTQPVKIVGVHEDNSEIEHVIPDRTMGWSQWSSWSVCSRTCDGGVARQLRTCGDGAGCRGEPVRYKICNMQPCRGPNSTEPNSGAPSDDAWRAQQCAAHDSAPYGGELFHWTPHRDDAEPCALTCRGTPHRGRHNHEEEERVLSDEDEATGVVIAVLGPRVQDGTRCRPGSLDMCIDGRCQKVGCDLRVGSTRRVDACGVCGGDNTDGAECARPRYRWAAAPASLCSATCGGGYKMSLSVCRDRVSGTDVSDQLCDESSKPAPAVVRCNPHPCPYKWYVGEWSSCSRTCGGGVRSRRVQCARAASSSSAGVSAPSNVTCAGTPPPRTTPCAQRECPRWIAGQWSGCSVSCGSGVQVRGAECAGGPNPGEGCDHTGRPETSRSCSTGIVCPDYRDTGNEDDIEDLIPGVVYHTQPLIQPYPPPEAKAEKLIGEQSVPSEATFIKDADWGQCSVTCGEGFRKKEVHCKIFLEFSRTIAKLPDYKCSGPKPSEETERCVMEPCSMAYGTSFGDSNQPSLFPSDSHRSPSYGDTNIRVAPGVPGKSYSWKEKGYTSCSASCLSGVQELIIQCVRDEDQKNASPYMCDPFTKPESRLRTCNDHPCPPRWNYTEFTSCSKTCGIGIQTREVNCIHEVTRGGVNTVVVPNNMCPQPPPPDRQYCNVLDCPVKWHAGEWSKCSKTCSGGIKERKVECKQVMAQSHIVERPDALCASARPPATKPCNTKPCVLDTSSPHIAQANSSYIQHDAKKKKITVVVGASATLFFGTQVRIKCPVKGYNRTKIQWAKDHTFITKSKKFKITKKGALRINELHYRDMGIYTCVAGRSTANLNLIVKHRPGEYVSSEEIERQRASPLEDSDTHDGLTRNIGRYTGQLQGTDSEDQSHEQRPGEISSKKYNRNKQQVGKEKQTYATATTTGKIPTQFSQRGNDNNYEDDEESSMPSHIVSMAEKSDVQVASSGGNRVMPYLKYFFANFQILWPFQVLGRGQRTVDTITDKNHLTLSSNKPIFHLSSENLIFSDEENNNLVITNDKVDSILSNVKNITAYSKMDLGRKSNIDSITTTTQSAVRPNQESRLILSELKWEQVYYDWIVTEWSPCSHSCGGEGHQIRGVSCVMQRENETRPVETSYCTDPGDDPPTSVRSCGKALCASWEAEEWPECEKSRCYDWNTAMQRRTVYCRANNGTRLSQSYCQASLRPSHRRECRKENCQAVWKTDQWSECRASCSAGAGAVGARYRVLRCVWAGSGAAAGAACGALSRPRASRVCTKNCSGRSGERHNLSCRDSSKFCSNVRTMKMCRMHRYKALCCKTCRN